MGRDLSSTAKFKNGEPIGNDPTLGGNNISLLEYVSHVQGADGSHTVTSTFVLGPGNYSVWVGGTSLIDALAQQANYQGLYAANQADGAAYAAAQQDFNNYR